MSTSAWKRLLTQAVATRGSERRAMEDISDLDLDADGDQALAAGLLRKRPNGLAINLGHKMV